MSLLDYPTRDIVSVDIMQGKLVVVDRERIWSYEISVRKIYSCHGIRSRYNITPE